MKQNSRCFRCLVLVHSIYVHVRREKRERDAQNWNTRWSKQRTKHDLLLIAAATENLVGKQREKIQNNLVNCTVMRTNTFTRLSNSHVVWFRVRTTSVFKIELIDQQVEREREGEIFDVMKECDGINQNRARTTQNKRLEKLVSFSCISLSSAGSATFSCNVTSFLGFNCGSKNWSIIVFSLFHVHVHYQANHRKTASELTTKHLVMVDTYTQTHTSPHIRKDLMRNIYIQRTVCHCIATYSSQRNSFFSF